MEVRTRFAPSPTGHLHIGGARTALYNYLFSKKQSGKFILRLEDTDKERSKNEYAKSILNTLKWLGINWDEGTLVGGDHQPYEQSKRLSIYDKYLEKLKSKNIVYEDEGAIRFIVPDEDIDLDDAICGKVIVNLKEQGARKFDSNLKKEVVANPDFIIKKPNGDYIFHFVNVVDDIEMKISHVIRGEDHLTNTFKHIALFKALDSKPPKFAHIPLNLNSEGTKMSKRDEGSLINEYKQKGFLPSAIVNYMALLGWSPKDDKEIFSVNDLQEAFNLSGVNKSNSKFDYEKCLWVNSQHIKALSEEDFIDQSFNFLKHYEETKLDFNKDEFKIKESLKLLQSRIDTFDQIDDLISPIFSDNIQYSDEDINKANKANDLFMKVSKLYYELSSVSSWTENSIKGVIESVANDLNLKLGSFMFPLRVVITGESRGLDLLPMIVIVGKDNTLKRIKLFLDKIK